MLSLWLGMAKEQWNMVWEPIVERAAFGIICTCCWEGGLDEFLLGQLECWGGGVDLPLGISGLFVLLMIGSLNQ